VNAAGLTGGTRGVALDIDLVERARHGDRDAFAVLAAGSVDRLYAIARVTLRDADRAEDAVQECLVRCWRDLPSLRDADRFEAWQRRLLMHAITDEFRRGRRFEAKVRVLHAEPIEGDASVALADRDELDRGFRRLSAEHRAILVLRYFQGLTLPEVADALGIAEGTAKSRLHYAMAALRAALDADSRAVAQKEVSA
jgi:RNA polymerase sigma-70 factor (ECF subfamily)